MPDEKAFNFRFIIEFFFGLCILSILMGCQKAFLINRLAHRFKWCEFLSDRYNPQIYYNPNVAQMYWLTNDNVVQCIRLEEKWTNQ